jgi:hypothetical protein
MTDESVEIVQGDDERWRWRAAAQDGAVAGVLSFKSRAEAFADAALHAQAPRDHTGRLVMSKDYVRRLISAIALPCAACADVYFGGVYWHRRGADGANWGVAIMNGAGDHQGCLDCVQAAREELRRRYAIVDEA